MNKVIGKIYIEHLFALNCIEKTKRKEKEAGMAHLKEPYCLQICSHCDYIVVNYYCRAYMRIGFNRFAKRFEHFKDQIFLMLLLLLIMSIVLRNFLKSTNRLHFC